MQTTEDFQISLLEIDGLTARYTLNNRQVIVYTSVFVHPGNFRLIIEISDLIDKYWKLEWGLQEFTGHLRDIQITSLNWPVYFNLLKKVIVEKKFELVEKDDSLIMNVDYPIGDAALKGRLSLNKMQIDREKIAKMIFKILDNSATQENVTEKRKRSESPSIRPAPVSSIGSVPKPIPANRQIKRRKTKQIGTKLAD